LSEKSKKSIDSTEPQEERVVTNEKFGHFLGWFGPLSLGNVILDIVRTMLTEPWFHGDSSTKESEDKLFEKHPGTFLVRFSSSSPGCFTISKISDGKIKHQKIQHKPGFAYEINGRSYPSLQDLIRGEAQALGLVKACDGSKYLKIFHDEITSGYVMQED